MEDCIRALEDQRWDNTEEECIETTEPVNAVQEFGHTTRKMEDFLSGLGQTMQSVLPVAKHSFGDDDHRNRVTATCLYEVCKVAFFVYVAE